MKISADKVKLCYTLYEDSPLYQLMETPLEIYELPHWDFRLEKTEGKYYNYIYKIIYLERSKQQPQQRVRYAMLWHIALGIESRQRLAVFES